MKYHPKTRPAPWTMVHPRETKAKPQRIRSVSKRHSALHAQYVKEAGAFVAAERKAGKTCPVVRAVPSLRNGVKYGHLISAKLTEVHHMAGRAGALLTFKPMWLAVSKQGHRWIHSNIEEARKMGFICGQGLWNNPRKVMAWLGIEQ